MKLNKDAGSDMPNEFVQQILTVFECSLLLAGGMLLLGLVVNPDRRKRWLGETRLETWDVSPLEFGVYVVLMLAAGFFFQATAQILLSSIVNRAADQAGMALFVYGLAFQVGAMLGWLAFRSMRETWQVGTTPESAAPAPLPGAPLPWHKALLYGGGTVLCALPVVLLISLGWTFFLRELGLPDDPQESIAIFSDTKSAALIAGMLVVACVFAPINEELLFRAGLFRFLRQRIGRTGALLLSGFIFGAVHMNWAGFVPLSVLGVILAIAYEATGSIRVPIVTHGLFNLLSIFFIVVSHPTGGT